MTCTRELDSRCVACQKLWHSAVCCVGRFCTTNPVLVAGPAAERPPETGLLAKQAQDSHSGSCCTLRLRQRQVRFQFSAVPFVPKPQKPPGAQASQTTSQQWRPERYPSPRSPPRPSPPCRDPAGPPHHRLPSSALSLLAPAPPLSPPRPPPPPPHRTTRTASTPWSSSCTRARPRPAPASGSTAS